jgi:DNA-binding PadR family transcriptional regulator
MDASCSTPTGEKIMKFMNDDSKLLSVMKRYKAITSYQLAYHPEIQRSPQVIRRRMRKLQKAGYVRSFQPSPTEAICYALTSKGWEVIAFQMGLDDAKQIPFSKKLPNVKSLFFRHMVLCNDTRLFFERSTHFHSDFILHQIIPEWMIEPDFRASSDPYEKFILRQKVAEMGSDKTFSLRPDMLMLHHHIAQSPDGQSLATYIEADRGTETQRQLSKKLPGYRLAYRQRLFEAFGAIKMRILFVFECKTKKRMKNFQRELQRFAKQLNDSSPPNPGPPGQPFDHQLSFQHSAAFVWSILMVTRHDLQQAGDNALTSDIYYNWQGEVMPFFSPSQSNTLESIEEPSTTLVPQSLLLPAPPIIEKSTISMFSPASLIEVSTFSEAPIPTMKTDQNKNLTNPNEAVVMEMGTEIPKELILPMELEEPQIGTEVLKLLEHNKIGDDLFTRSLFDSPEGDNG